MRVFSLVRDDLDSETCVVVGNLLSLKMSNILLFR